MCYVLYKLIRKSKVVPLEECDFDTGRVTRLEIEAEDEDEKNQPWYRKVLNIIA